MQPRSAASKTSPRAVKRAGAQGRVDAVPRRREGQQGVSVFKDGLYQGKTVFVTGGSSGINFRIAEAFGEAGARVAINGRNVEKLNKAVDAMKAKGIAVS